MTSRNSDIRSAQVAYRHALFLRWRLGVQQDELDGCLVREQLPEQLRQ